MLQTSSWRRDVVVFFVVCVQFINKKKATSENENVLLQSWPEEVGHCCRLCRLFHDFTPGDRSRLSRVRRKEDVGQLQVVFKPGIPKSGISRHNRIKCEFWACFFLMWATAPWIWRQRWGSGFILCKNFALKINTNAWRHSLKMLRLVRSCYYGKNYHFVVYSK